MLPYCQPEKIIEEWQSLGEDLSGDRTMNSLYTFQFLGIFFQNNIREKKIN